MFPTRIKMTGTSATITPERDLASLGTHTGTGGKRDRRDAGHAGRGGTPSPPLGTTKSLFLKNHLRRSAR